MNHTNADSDGLVDYYRTLNLAPTATAKEIREAYFRLKNTYDTDNQALYSLASESYIHQALQEVEKAFSVLCDDQSRRMYDRQAGYSTESSSRESLTRTIPPQEPLNVSASLERSGASEEIGGFKVRYKAAMTVRQIVAPQASDDNIKNKVQSLLDQGKAGDGSVFRRIREEVGVDKMSMQEHTKISISYIEHIEENRFEMLPQPVYVKGFLKSYLGFLGISETDSLIELYMGKYREWMKKNNR